MKTTDLLQGSDAWLAHRRQFFNASDAPAMLGYSTYKTRNELLHEMHSGFTKQVDAGTRRRFDDGHRFEALARPLAEAIIGDDLYPVTGTEGRYSASFDGLTMDESIAWEHKTLNDELRAAIRQQGGNANDFLPMMYRIQMEQQCMVSGASRVLFTATKWDGDDLVDECHCWYTPDPELRARIVAGWELFEVDLALYIPPVVAPVLVAAAQEALPAVSVQLNGAIAVIDNLDVFGVALTAYIGKINKSPQTDQDFVDLKAVVATLEKAEAALDAAETSALASISSVNAMQSAIGTLRTLTKTNRLLCDKIYKAENERRKLEIVQGGKDAAAAYITGLNKRLGRPYMPTIASDFAGVAKGLRTLARMQNAVDTELARFKIEASAVADLIQINMTALADKASSHGFLFADAAQLVLKNTDDFLAVMQTRIAMHDKAEADKAEAQRERIRAEEAARVEREHAERLARDQREAAAAELAAAKASESTILSPAVQVLNEQEGAQRFAAVHPTVAFSAPKVVSLPVRTAPQIDTGATMKLGEINAMLAPIALSAEGLATLGFTPVATDKSAKLYRVVDLPHICAAIVAHVQATQTRSAA